MTTGNSHSQHTCAPSIKSDAMEKKVSSMYGQRYTASEASSMTVAEEMDLKVYGTMDEEKYRVCETPLGTARLCCFLP